MKQGRTFTFTVIIVAIIVVVAALLIGQFVLRGDGSLMRDVLVDDSIITPNADGTTDATTIRYEITRNATVSIYFENADNERFYFRRERPRGAGEYEVLFSGVVEGYELPDETIQGQILARLLQDGTYTWFIEATDHENITETQSGTLKIEGATTELPEMRGFSLDRTLFTPNQDGIDDRVLIQFDLVKEAEVQVYLLYPDGVRDPIFEQERTIEPGAPGRHYYDYEAGVDKKETPPPDGTYPIVGFAQDAEGQKIQIAKTIDIQFGGVPRADIISPAVGDTVDFSATSVIICDTLTFSLTLRNDGVAPLRTTGPVPGTVYDSDWNYNTVGWETEAGAWRVAIGYENELSNYPYRWALGDSETLTKIGDHYYLMPGERVTITGGIRIVGPFGERNPQPVWAGLIHEDVEISQFNNRVGTKQILIEFPDPTDVMPCDDRPVPFNPNP